MNNVNNSNILDTILHHNEDQKRANLNPKELAGFLLEGLSSREKEVLSLRYGLSAPEGFTLEAIGQKYGITRERVRQIESNALKKAVKNKKKDELLADLASVVTRNLELSGHLKSEDVLIDEILEHDHDVDIERNCLRFIFDKFLLNYIEPLDIVDIERSWKIKDKKLDHYHSLINKVKSILESIGEPLHIREIIDRLKGEGLDNKLENVLHELEDLEKALHSYLEASKHFRKNLFDKWGLHHWRSVNPKRMRDKIYLIMHKYKKPLHYKEIAEKINLENFDNKKAHPATIHNELILDDRFVLIGRGTYALREWGYKPGILSEVLVEILQEVGLPLSKDEIMQEVFKRRVVKEGSVILALSNKDKFRKVGNKYSLK